MAKALLSFGAETMADDEQQIADGYRAGWKAPVIAGVVLGATAYFSDTKDVVAVGAFLIVAAVCTVEGRLYDLCLRLRRTNILLLEHESSKTPPQ
jgi:hypothetical protein